MSLTPSARACRVDLHAQCLAPVLRGLTGLLALCRATLQQLPLLCPEGVAPGSQLGNLVLQLGAPRLVKLLLSSRELVARPRPGASTAVRAYALAQLLGVHRFHIAGNLRVDVA